VTDVRVTARSGDESRLVRAALDDGADTIAVLGGDGTWGKCAAALAESGADARMAFLCGGTGNDFAKNFPAPARDLHAMARLVAEGGEEWRADMGRVESGNHADWFLNVVGFGFDVAVLEQTARGGALTGRAVYVATALRQLLRYPGLDLTLNALGAGARRATMLVISNGRSFGGAFRIAPHARVDDGLLDLVAIGDVRGLARVPLFVRALRGTHLAHPRVTAAQANAFTLRFAKPPGYEVDGELRRAHATDVRITCVRGAIRVLAASAASRRPGAS
jgi:diacylglycerol kinase (ATP)